MKLSELKTGEEGIVVKILGHGAFRKRVIEMGFVRGRVVKVLLDAPLKDPIKYELLGYAVSLRRAEAEMIEVVKVENNIAATPKIDKSSLKSGLATESSETYDINESTHNKAEHAGHTINVALIGNPNCGKTSLYNDLSGAKEHVGNYGGVTVDIKSTILNTKAILSVSSTSRALIRSLLILLKSFMCENICGRTIPMSS